MEFLDGKSNYKYRSAVINAERTGQDGVEMGIGAPRGVAQRFGT